MRVGYRDDLTCREWRVLELRYGLGEERRHTLLEVGKIQQVTQERIRQIEAKGLRKLRGMPVGVMREYLHA